MIQYQYRQVHEWGAVFKIQEGHGYEKVVYAGSAIGITGELHRHNEELVATLLCHCHPRLEIRPISARQYAAILQDVFQQLAA
jgi:hypothetical protein